MTPKTPVHKIHGTYLYGRLVVERAPVSLHANMVSFEKAFNLYAFVVDVHSNKLININYLTTLFELHGESLSIN